MTRKHIFEADVLRAVAIMIIILHHSYDYFFYKIIDSPLVESLNEFFGYLGLGVLFFISGYLLYNNHQKISSIRDIIHFYKKRVLRIYPLYWAALAVSLFCFGFLYMSMYHSTGLSLYNVIIYFLGLQMLGKSFMNYWFIGVILVYYIMYPIIVCVSKKTGDIAIIYLCMAAIILFVYAVTKLIDYRLFYFLMVFASGIIACKIKVFEQRKIEKYVPGLLVFALLAVAVETFISNMDNFVAGEHISKMVFLASAISYNIIIVSVCLILFWMVRKYGSLVWSEKLYLPQIAYGSYAAYLFDVVCFAIIYEIIQFFGVGGVLLSTITLVVGFPIAFITGYFVQKIDDSFKKFFNSRTLGGSIGASHH